MADICCRVDALSSKFAEKYGASPKVIVRSPGRVNLIGEHTDYNDGYVLPMGIDRDVIIAATPRADSVIRLYSADYDESTSFSVDNIEHAQNARWSNYPRGVVDVLSRRGIRVCGADMAVQGNVPLGSGLSSSAALEVACAMAFQAMSGFDMTGTEMAQVCQAAENEFIGVKCGIMDQLVSRLAQKDHALFIDCRTLSYECVPLTSEGVKFVVTNTCKKHALVDSEYNKRRQECNEAVSILKEHLPDIIALRDVTSEDFLQYASYLPDVVRARAEHVIKEDERVKASVDALKAGDLAAFGKLMDSSHVSLRDLYQVSCEELDVLVDAAHDVSGVLGSRMTGGGFGGCTVSLVEESSVETFQAHVANVYQEKTGIQPIMYVCAPEAGAEVLKCN